MRVAVVGHVEWAQFARVEQMPAPGQIVPALESWEEPAGGGAVAAVQLAKLAGECLFVTALGDDALGHRAKAGLEKLGVRVEAAWRAGPQRRAFVHLDRAGERTITVLGERLGPRGDEALAWGELEGADGVYFTAGDGAALRAARTARALVASVRAGEALSQAEVELDMLVASAVDEGERYTPGQIEPAPRFVALTDGPRGGSLIRGGDDRTTRWSTPPPPGPAVDAYGAGDSFAGGLTFGLAAGFEADDAIALAARCGAACVTGAGPFTGQLTRSDLQAPGPGVPAAS